jgi:hypothetical protein
MNILLRATLLLLIVVAVFDPADQVTHLKVPLFVGLWVIFILDLLISGERMAPVDDSLLMFILVFAAFLPLTSILTYFVRGGQPGSYDGFQYLKSFLFLTLAVILVVKKIDAIRPLSIVLSLLSGALIIMTIFIYYDPELAGFLWPIGDATGIFAIGERTYANLSYSYVYFHTAPLLVLSLAYFAYRYVTSESRAHYINAALLLVNLVAMLCSGTRNDIMLGLLTPFAVLLWYSGKTQRRMFYPFLLMAMVIAGTYGNDIIQAMFDPLNESNALKLMHLRDYGVLFSDPTTLLFGQGLGSHFYSSGRGAEISVTELTYLEFIRNFGLIMAFIYYGLLLYPLIKLRKTNFKKVHYLLI